MSKKNNNKNNNNNNEKKLEDIDESKRIKTIQRERIVLKGRLKQERLRGFIRFIVSACIIVFLSLFSKLHGLYFEQDAFKYVGSSAVEIINNRIVPSYKIIAILQTVDVPHGCVFFARTGDIKKKLMQLKPIEKVYIRRYAFPARIQ